MAQELDTLWLVFQDPQFGALTGNAAPMNARFFYSDPDRDTIYTLTIPIAGRSLSGFNYVTRYRSEEEGGGFAEGRFRARYIRPTGPNRFPRTYTFPLDVWQKDPPLPFEQPFFSPVVSVEREGATIPTVYTLDQNYPNPFNPSTTIRYSIPTAGRVSLKVYNLLGQEVATIFEGTQAAGTYTTTFNAMNLSSGVYFYRLRAGQYSDVKKMVLIK